MQGDLRSACRSFLRTPAFTVGLLLVLALGIGANGAVFSLVKAVLLQPLPYHEPDRLAMVTMTYDQWPGIRGYGMTRAWLDVIRERTSDAFEVAAVRSWVGNLESRMDLVLDDRAERLRASFVTPNFFRVAGIGAAHGRVFGDADANADVTPIVVSDAFWRRALGGDDAAIGRTVTVAAGIRPRVQRSFRVIGVLAPAIRFTYPDETEIWALESWAEVAREPAGAITFNILGRLESGATIAGVDAQMAAAAASLQGLRDGARFRLQTIDEWVAGESRPSLVMLASVAGLLLVIACATVATGLLVRVAARQRELAVRASLGADRRRLLRQLLAEGVLFAAAGTVAGCALAVAVMPVLRALVPPVVPRGDEIGVDASMLAFGAAVAVVVTVLATLAPAILGSRLDLVSAVKETSAASGGTSRTSMRWRGTLVGVQSFVAAGLLVGAALLLASFWRLNHVELGYDADDVITVEMRLLDMKYRDDDALRRFQDDVIARVSAIPGVTAAGLTTAVPFRGVDFLASWDRPGCEYTPPASPPPGCGDSFAANSRAVDAAYFDVMRVPLLRGRLFGAEDVPEGPRVAVVSQSFAREMFGGADPIGRRFDNGQLQVIGVVDDVRYGSLDQAPRAAVYANRRQQPNSLVCVVLRAEPGAAVGPDALHRAIRAVDPAVPAMRVSTIGQIRRDSVADRRFYMTTTVAFAALALALTAVGLVIVILRAVIERRREIAIRSALGARTRQLVVLLARQSLVPAAIGLFVGLAAAWLSATALEPFLFETDPRSPDVYGAVAVLLGLAAVAACLWPVRRLGTAAPWRELRE